MRFNVTHRYGKARVGQLHTAHGIIDTPVFMPVGTRGTVKALTVRQTEELGAQIILGNTYHLLLKPGYELITKAGGLHAFMDWPRALLTDSGGYQVFSLSALNKITDTGVHFRSHIDGSKWFIGPEESMAMQKALGSDIVMAFDQCPPYPATHEQVLAAVNRTSDWARTCRDFSLQPHQNLFGIIQGGVHPDLRTASAHALTAMNFDGYAIGGLSVGEPAEMMYSTLDHTTPLLPDDKPRYLMGVGTPRNLIEAVARGVDMFDCVLPTRNARNGTAFTWSGKISLKSAKYASDFSPLDPHTDSEASRHTRAYLRHLFNVEELTAYTLTTHHNLAFYLSLMAQIRTSLKEGTFPALYEKIVMLYPD